MKVLWICLVMLVSLAGCQSRSVSENSVAPSNKSSIHNDGLPSHPDELKYGARTLSFPDRSDSKHTLADGSVAFIVEDHSLPLVKISLLSKAGAYLLPAEQAGLATLTASMLRDGGTKALSATELDERLDFLASSVSFGIGDTSSTASLDSLSSNLAETLTLMFDMITLPGLDNERLGINRSRMIEAMRRRNDDTRSIEPRVWSELLLGESFFVNHQATENSVDTVNNEAIRAFAQRVFASGQLYIAVSGDVDTQNIIDLLNEQISRLRLGGTLPAIPETPQTASAGLYGVNKDDVTQTRVSVGHPGPRVGDPDEYAIAVMNDVLGGGGFTSRITSRVRSDEGLAYSAGSGFRLGRYYPGQFRAFFQSKNQSVSQALDIVLEEINTIRNEPISDKELATARESQVSFLADLFSSANRTATRFANDAMVNRDPEYWANYEANIRKVTQADVLRVAKKHLQPEQLRILLVGKLDEALAGEGEFADIEARLSRKLVKIGLKDPLTLEPLSD